jgi:hypothetical protein
VITADSTPDSIKQIAPNYDSFSSSPLLTEDTIDYLWREYKAICRNMSPNWDALSSEARSRILEEIKKKPDRTSLARLPRTQIEDLLLSMVGPAST